MSRHLLLWAFVAPAIAFSASAHASDPSAADVAQAVDQKQFHKADVMLRDLIARHPHSARAHYMLAQVLGYEQRPDDGLTELDDARSIDPTCKFASVQRVAAVQDKLEAEQRLLHPVNQAVEPVMAIPAELNVAAPTATERPAAPAFHLGAAVWAGVGGILLLIVAIVVWRSGAAKRRREEESAALRMTQLKELTAMIHSAGAASLDARLAASASSDSAVSDVRALSSDLTEAMERVQGGDSLSASEMNVLRARSNTLSGNGAKPAPVSATVPPSRDNAASYARPVARTYVDPVPTPYRSNVDLSSHSTVIVQQSSDDNFVAGLVMGEALRPAPEIIERDVYIDDRSDRASGFFQANDMPVEPAPSYERRDYVDTPADPDPPAAFDPGNGGSNDWGSGGGNDVGGSDSGGFDAGSSDSNTDF